MQVRMKDNPELEFYSAEFNVYAIGEVLGCHKSFGVDLFFIKDLDVFIEKNINFFAWKDMRQAFRDHDLITDNFNRYFFEPIKEEDRKRGFTL